MKLAWGNWLKGKRGRRGEPGFITQEDLALRMGVSRTYVAQLEEMAEPPTYVDDPHRALWEVAFETGMRFAELVSLRWTEVDLDRKTIAVIRTLTRTEGGQIVEGTPKSEAGVRTIAISDELAGVLVEHRRVVDEQARLMPGWNPLGLVFPAESGPWLGNKVVNDWLKEACDTAGVPRITAHQMRHTSGSMSAEAGIPIKVITQRLGHSHVATALQLYIHPDKAEHEKAASTIGAALRGKQIEKD